MGVVKLFFAVVIALVIGAMALIGNGTPEDYGDEPLTIGENPVYALASYVAYDRDADRQPSVGDEVRWFIYSAETTTVTLTCWTAADKAKQTQKTTATFTGPLTGLGTPSGVTLAAAGYCESNGVTTAGTVVGVGWFPVAP